MDKNSKTIRQMTAEVKRSFDSYTKQGTKQWDADIAAKDLPYQVGSITKIMMQMKNERWAEGKSAELLKVELSDELADIIGIALFIAHEMQIDIEAAWEAMLDSDQKKISTRSKG